MSDGTLIDYHVHLLGHLEVGGPAAKIGDFVETAARRGMSEVGFADHDGYVEMLDFAAIDRSALGRPDVKIRKGIEVDFVPGRAREIQSMLNGLNLDYAIGSVHSIEGWGFDDIREIAGWQARDVDQVYCSYYAVVSEAARSRLFNVIGHLDLPKVFAYHPSGDATAYAQGAIGAIRDAGCAIEINTSGARKTAADMYPSKAIVAACFAAGIPVTLGSDAHVPEDAGRDIALARDLARQAGYTRVTTFESRKPIMRPI